MPLQSHMLRGDRALEACLVDGKAHVVEGSRGPHVRKLQQALAVLDGALISLDEVSSELYGPTTATAVLNYKRDRKIINFTYQRTADNIVGKMTIAALDREMLIGEARPPLRGCLDETRPSGAGGGAVVGAGNARGFAEGAPGSAPATVLRISFQDALGENEIGIATPTRILLLSAKAQKLFRPFNIILQTDFLGSFPFPKAIAERDEIDVGGLRKAAQKANPGSESSLRVILCKFLPTTSTGTSNGAITGIEGFKNFVLVNKEKVHPDLGTLAHEMIHCSNDFLMSDLLHEKDLKNVFSFGPNRTIVSPQHVTSLRKCFFR